MNYQINEKCTNPRQLIYMFLKSGNSLLCFEPIIETNFLLSLWFLVICPTHFGPGGGGSTLKYESLVFTNHLVCIK